MLSAKAVGSLSFSHAAYPKTAASAQRTKVAYHAFMGIALSPLCSFYRKPRRFPRPEATMQDQDVRESKLFESTGHHLAVLALSVLAIHHDSFLVLRCFFELLAQTWIVFLKAGTRQRNRARNVPRVMEQLGPRVHA